MIAEEFNAYDWGGAASAIAARTSRTAELRELGYAVFLDTQRALNRDFDGYQLVAIKPEQIRPKLPGKS